MTAETVTVAIITYARPQYIQQCLDHLGRLRTSPHQVIVVDASPDTRTRELIARDFPHVLYLRNDLGRGTMSESRQIGLAQATGDIVSFIDDDAFVDTEWLDRLIDAFQDDSVAGVGGRADNGRPGEDLEGIGSIGRLLPNGDLTGFFAADPGKRIEVDHFLGQSVLPPVDAVGDRRHPGELSRHMPARRIRHVPPAEGSGTSPDLRPRRPRPPRRGAVPDRR